jgi:hypothetical protein
MDKDPSKEAPSKDSPSKETETATMSAPAKPVPMFDIKLEPSKANLTLMPSESKSLTIRLTNEGENPKNENATYTAQVSPARYNSWLDVKPDLFPFNNYPMDAALEITIPAVATDFFSIVGRWIRDFMIFIGVNKTKPEVIYGEHQIRVIFRQKDQDEDGKGEKDEKEDRAEFRLALEVLKASTLWVVWLLLGLLVLALIIFAFVQFT